MNLNFLKNKKILVTGGTGSIGSALTLKLIKSNCNVIRVMSNDENGLYEFSKKINRTFPVNYNIFENQMNKNRIRFFLGDVRDLTRCREVTKDVDIVIHAAAVKHVNIAEYNPNEALQTNYVGTKNILKASIMNGVSKFLFISTDKVVAPMNIMGKSKLLAENYAKNCKIKNKIKISCIRFGNVIGSRGSVVPIFIELLKNKKNIIVSNPKMSRFVMSIDQAVKSILEATKMMRGKEVFILKSMTCFRILDLAEALVKHFQTKKFRSKIMFAEKINNEKLEEELFLKKELPYIFIKNNMFIIKKYKNNYNELVQKKLNKYRVSNFNYMNKTSIIRLLKKLDIL